MSKFKMLAVVWGVSCSFSCFGCSSGETIDSTSEGLGGLGGGGGTGMGSGGLWATGCGPAAGGVSVVLTGSASIDTTIDATHPTINYGNATSLQVDANRASVLRWDTTSIPSSAVVLDACIGLTLTDASNDTFTAYQLRKSWNEATTTWFSPWDAAGANSRFDRGGTAIATLNPSGPSYAAASVSTSVVQSWVSQSSTNFGVIVLNGPSDTLSFWSSEATGNARPLLRIRYQ